MYTVMSDLTVVHPMTIRFQDYQILYMKQMGEFHASQSEEPSCARDAAASVTDLESLATPTLKEKPSFASRAESQCDLVGDETSMFPMCRIFSTPRGLLMSSRQ